MSPESTVGSADEAEEVPHPFGLRPTSDTMHFLFVT